ncbi:MAG: lipase family protein [Flammeovirgaceae bacterium]
MTSLKRFPIFLLLAVVFTLSSCNDDEGNNASVPEGDVVVSSSLAFQFTPPILISIALQQQLGDFVNYIDHPVTAHRIVYKTQFKGEQILASGIIAYPEGISNAPLLSAQHGTIFADSKAPSNLDVLNGQMSGFEFFASAGYITIIPDFIGYGESVAIVHPYYRADYTASATLDMIKAAEEFLAFKNITVGDKLFLFGYSEGGFATMATLREIESNPSLGLTVTAAAAGAGGFDIKGIMDHVLDLTTHPEPGFLSFVVHSYNTSYDWNRNLADIFQEPYASRIPDLLDGSKDKDQINAQLTTTINDLVNPAFKDSVQNGLESQLTNAMIANSVHDWAPQSKVKLLHSLDDEVLPIANTASTYQSYLSNGALDVTFDTVGGDSHATGALETIEVVIAWFNTLK